MPPTPSIVERPQRWDVAFDPAMTDADVDRLLAIPPFSNMPAEKFSKRTPLREILRNDTAIRRYRKGEIVVRQGDYGTSAFMILSGTVRVVLKPDLPPAMLGRQAPSKKGFFRMLAHSGRNAGRRRVFSASSCGRTRDWASVATRTNRYACSSRICHACWTSIAPRK